VNRKADKVEETATPSAAKKAAPKAVGAKVGVKQVDGAAFKKVAAKLFAERKDLLHKLAQ